MAIIPIISPEAIGTIAVAHALVLIIVVPAIIKADQLPAVPMELRKAVESDGADLFIGVECRRLGRGVLIAVSPPTRSLAAMISVMVAFAVECMHHDSR